MRRVAALADVVRLFYLHEHTRDAEVHHLAGVPCGLGNRAHARRPFDIVSARAARFYACHHGWTEQASAHDPRKPTSR
jgi:hypothetical protein